MANFSTEEIELINQQKKQDSNLPEYFSAENNNFIPIGRDFESYLILQPVEQKQRILSWIKEAREIQTSNVDRDELLLKYLQIRLDDSNKRIEELDDTLNQFNSVRANLVPNRFADVVEVDLLARSLQRPVDELQFIREKAYHEQNIAKLVKAQKEKTNHKPLANAATQQELSQWQLVVNSYRGQITFPNNPEDVPRGSVTETLNL